MKFQNRIASLLSAAMLALNCIGSQSAFAASDTLDKTGMTRLASVGTNEWKPEGNEFSVPDFQDYGKYYLCCTNSQPETHAKMTVRVELWCPFDLYERNDGKLTKTFIEEPEEPAVEYKMSVPDQPGQSAYMEVDFDPEDEETRWLKLKDPSVIRVFLEEPEQLAEGAECSFTLYGYRKTDEKDASLQEVGGTTGTAVQGTYDHEYNPWETDEQGRLLHPGTNAYMGSTMEITAYPQRVFAFRERFNTKGLKVRLIEHRTHNNRDYDISDCLRIWTDFDPTKPGEYLVYIRTDFNQFNELKSDDYIFYTVVVQEEVTTAETAETTETTESLSQTGFSTLRGDVDCSGQVAIADAVMLARYLAEDEITVTAQGLVNAELDGDSTALSAADLAVLLQGIAGTVTL
ncbi:MAG: hypothetical protein IK107_04410 [Oscillospiraceae bacterium]|nr:hypothetical protein [Oscillospiraceae bacterium]